jgi:hypothetical protein
VRASWLAGHPVYGPALLSLVRITPNMVRGGLLAARPCSDRT